MSSAFAFLKLKEHLDECREIIDSATVRSLESNPNSEEYKLLRKIYDSIAKTEDMFI